MLDWNRPFEYVPGMILFVALIFFGVLIGVSLGFFTRELSLGEGWAPIIAGVIAATAAACVAFYLDDRKHRRELRVPVNRVRLAFYDFERALAGVDSAVKWDALRATKGERPRFSGIRFQCTNAIDLAKAIPTNIVELPHATITQLRNVKGQLKAGLEVDLTYCIDKLEEEANREEAGLISLEDDEDISWSLVQEILESIRLDLTRIESQLAKLL